MQFLTTAAAWQDPGLLRERLTEIRSDEFISLSLLRSERAIVGQISRLTGISAEQIRADVDADVVALEGCCG